MGDTSSKGKGSLVQTAAFTLSPLCWMALPTLRHPASHPAMEHEWKQVGYPSPDSLPPRASVVTKDQDEPSQDVPWDAEKNPTVVQ